MKNLACLIHNDTGQRLADIRPMLSDFIERVCRITGNVQIELMEVSFQPELKRCSLFLSLLRDIRQTKLEWIWSKYIRAENGSVMRTLEVFLKVVIYRYVLHPSLRKAWQSQSAIEIALTSKHTRAW